MVATRYQKRVALEKSNPLQEPGILHRILDYLGLGHYLFIALVSREWKQLYSTLSPYKVDSLDEDRFFEEVKCKIHTTLASAAFGSASRAKLAHRFGLKLAGTSFALQYTAGRAGNAE
eukprot:15222-Heterococcus_DN1.PRE.1